MTIRFPLPYSSLSSLYRGITGKSSDWIYPKTSLFEERKTFQFTKHTWDVSQIGVVFPYFSEYTDSAANNKQMHLSLHLSIQQKEKTFINPPVEYIERIHIQHVMKDVYHLSVYSEKLENKGKNVSVILNNQYKWMLSDSIQHLILDKWDWKKSKK